MKTLAPKAVALFSITVMLLVLVSFGPPGFAQKRGKAGPKSASRASGLVQEADKLADDNKLPEAIEVYKLAIRLDAAYGPAYGGLGDAYLNSGNWEQALATYKEQVRIAPNDPGAQYNLGYAYNTMGRHGEAFAPLVKAINLDPRFSEAYYAIAYAYSKSGQYEKSISFFKSAIGLKPGDGETLYGLGEAYAHLGKAELANEQLKKLATIDPKLAKKLEKEIPAALATASTSSKIETVQTTAASADQANQPQPAPAVKVVVTPQQALIDKSASPAEQPKTITQDAPAITAPAVIQQQQPVTTQPATSATQAVVNTETANPQTAAQPAQPSSRQLQQLPAAPPPSAQKPAPVTAASDNQIDTLPVGPKRWALVIGVDKYADPQISPLMGSDNDARLIADALVRYAGFPQDQVILLSTSQPAERQPTRVNILRRLSNLSTTVPKDGLLLISFAGHGMERGGQAFLLPSDSQVSDQISFLEETAISINRMKERVKETGVGQVVVFLDACRNDPGGRADAPNPLTTAYINAFNFDVRNREVQAFATVYATGIGQRAYEYTEKKQGYFSWAIVEGLKGAAANDKGEITLAQLVKYVQESVPKRIAIDLGSTKQQRPFAIIEGYRAEQLVMAVNNTATMASNPATPNIAVVDPAAIELSYWETIKNSTNPDDFKGYLDKYPDGQFAALAKSRASGIKPAPTTDSGSLEMVYWNAIKDSHNASDFRAYVTRFPGGLFVELANSRINLLESEERDRERSRVAAEATDRARKSHVFDVKDAGGTDGSLTTTPGSIAFEVRKRSDKNDKRNVTIPCADIRRVEAGKSPYQPPHVNVYLTPVDGKDRMVTFLTSSGGQKFLVATPIVDITSNVIGGIIEACNMARVNQ